jgi:PqqD family protein of HPr-rel-A system
MAWAAWEQDNSLFHGETGETHLLSELPALLLRAMARAPQTEDALCTLAAEQCEVRLDAAWRERIRGILGSLEQLELVAKTTQTRS